MLPPFVPGAFKTLHERARDAFEAELAKRFTTEGRRYFDTEPGKLDLAKFVNFVKTKNIKVY